MQCCAMLILNTYISLIFLKLQNIGRSVVGVHRQFNEMFRIAANQEMGLSQPLPGLVLQVKRGLTSQQTRTD